MAEFRSTLYCVLLFALSIEIVEKASLSLSDPPLNTTPNQPVGSAQSALLSIRVSPLHPCHSYQLSAISQRNSVNEHQLCSKMLFYEEFIFFVFFLLTPLGILCYENVEKLIEETSPSFHSTHEASRRLGDNIPIPLLSVSLNADSKNYLARLLDSIDYPVRSIIVQIGNDDSTVRARIIGNATRILQSKPHLNVTITEGKNSVFELISCP